MNGKTDTPHEEGREDRGGETLPGRAHASSQVGAPASTGDVGTVAITPAAAMDFLRVYPPFYFFDGRQHEELAARVAARRWPGGATVFRQGESPGAVVYVVRRGAVDLFMEHGGGRELADRCDEGQLFGLRPLLAGSTYALTAVTAEDTLLYELPADLFRRLAESTPKAMLYIAANLASGRDWRKMAGIREKLAIAGNEPEAMAFQLLETQPLDATTSLVTCGRDLPIREAATLMSDREVGSIIVVDGDNLPLGVVTDKDLRRRVATGREPVYAPVWRIMSSPVVTAPPSLTVAEVQMELVRNRLNHLVLTRDGSPASPVVGVLTEHDILILQANNPAVLVREIERAGGVDELRLIRDRAESLLKRYLHQEVAISYVSRVITEINDALVLQLIRLAEAELAGAGEVPAGLRYCWLALGSEGRGEQLLRTDQDNALLFADVEAERLEEVRAWCLRLGRRVNELLLHCGFALCPGNYMAGNPSWCLSLSEWKQRFSAWILSPEPLSILHATVFFDFRPVYGAVSLAHLLTAHVLETAAEQSIFFLHLARGALENPPPLTFFRDIVVERRGGHKDEFDIKKRAMLPLVDAARVLALHQRIGRVSGTPDRLLELAAREPANGELYGQAAEAYRILMRLRTIQGLRNGDSGRYFKLSELSKMERVLLRNLFRPIEELQTLVRVRFKAALF